MSYLEKFGTARTPQSEAIPGAGQVENSAGGFAWEVDSWTRLRRFLILGSEGGSYYADERKLTVENLDGLRACLAADGVRTVGEIAEVSSAGRAPRNDQALFALAMVIAEGSAEAKAAALEALPKVARTGTHLFQLMEFLDGTFGQKNYPRSKRRALGDWYLAKSPDALAYQLVKYRQRNGWTHRDVLRLAHPKTIDPAYRALFEWVTKRDADGELKSYLVGGLAEAMPRLVHGFEQAQKAETAAETAALVRELGLPREALNTEHLRTPEVWEALLDNQGKGMPLTALIRNLATMTRIGLLTPTSQATALVVRQLSDDERLRRARVHPYQVLVALKTYAAGRSVRGSATWAPIPRIVDALDSAFYAAFGNVESTGKRYLLGLDVSGSMDGSCVGDPALRLSAREASSAMALVTAAVEPLYEVVGFTAGGYPGAWMRSGARNEFPGSRIGYSYGRDASLVPLPFSAKQRLDDVTEATARLPFGGTDCALPMLYALEQEREVDVFVIYTDSETWHGDIHPSQALAEYRRASGIDARLVVVGMTANEFSIADPRDPGMLDVVGFDTAAPQVIADFAQGRL